MSQTNDPTEFETEGSSAVGTANKGGKAAAKQVVDIAVSKASGSFGLPVIIGIAAVVLVVLWVF